MKDFKQVFNANFDTDVGYLVGKARNEDIEGDGTGTPWHQIVINDLMMGPVSALFNHSDVVADNSDEKAGQSQWVDALKTLAKDMNWGDRYKGSFTKGFTYTSEDDVGRRQDGEYYKYIGSDPLPKSVPAGLNPVNFPTEYALVENNSASTTTTNTTESTQDFIDSFALKIFQSPTDGRLTEIQTRTVEANEVYEVRKTSDDSLATIYSDEAGTTEIVQNGTDNKSGSDGVVEFFVGAGEFSVNANSQSEQIHVTSNVSEVLSANRPIKHLPDFYASSLVSYSDASFTFKPQGTTLQFVFITVPVSQAEDALIYWDLTTNRNVTDAISATNPYVFCQSVDDLGRANPVTSLQSTSSDRFGFVSTILATEITKDFLAISLRVPTGADIDLTLKGITIKQGGIDIFTSDVFKIFKSSEKWGSNTLNQVFGDEFAVVAVVDNNAGSFFKSPERVDIHPKGSVEFLKPPYSLSFYSDEIQPHPANLASNIRLHGGEYDAYRQDYLLELTKDTNITTENSNAIFNAGKEIKTSDWTTVTMGNVLYVTAPLDVSDNRSSGVRSGAQQPSIIARAALNTTRSVYKYDFTNASTAAEVQATAFTYWYDFSNSTIHFSFDASLPTSYVYVANALAGIFTSSNINLNVENVDVYGANGDSFRVQPSSYSRYLSGKGGVYCSFTNCTGEVSAVNAFSIDNMDAQLSACSAMSSGNDGYNFHDNGLTHIANSKSWFNSADGMSHHEACIGHAERCSFRFNGVAGSVPAYGAYVWHESCELTPSTADSLRSNSYAGKWAVLSNSAGNGKAVFSNCVTLSPVDGSLYEAIAQDVGSNTSMYITNATSTSKDIEIYSSSGLGVNNRVIQ